MDLLLGPNTMDESEPLWIPVASTDRPRMVGGSMGPGVSASTKLAEPRSAAPLAPISSTAMPDPSAVLTMWVACIVRDRVFASAEVRSYVWSTEGIVRVSSYAGGAEPETGANGSMVVVKPSASSLPAKLSAELETSAVMCVFLL